MLITLDIVSWSGALQLLVYTLSSRSVGFVPSLRFHDSHVTQLLFENAAPCTQTTQQSWYHELQISDNTTSARIGVDLHLEVPYVLSPSGSFATYRCWTGADSRPCGWHMTYRFHKEPSGSKFSFECMCLCPIRIGQISDHLYHSHVTETFENAETGTQTSRRN